MVPRVLPPRIESVSLRPVGLLQALLIFRAKCSGGSCSKPLVPDPQTVLEGIFMMELPCIAFVGFIFFGASAVFSLDICCLFAQGVLAVTPSDRRCD